MKYYCSCSGGKDSVATVILAHEHNEPLDEVVFAEVMFSQNISGELPEHIDFIKNTLFPKFNEWGYKTQILRANTTYTSEFFHMNCKGIRKGKLRGFPMQKRCYVQRDCKVKPIKDYRRSIGEDFVEYVGIAKDEEKRLVTMRKDEHKVSLLEKYDVTEQIARELAEEYGLLSPSYAFAPRGGVGFALI